METFSDIRKEIERIKETLQKLEEDGLEIAESDTADVTQSPQK